MHTCLQLWIECKNYKANVLTFSENHSLPNLSLLRLQYNKCLTVLTFSLKRILFWQEFKTELR